MSNRPLRATGFTRFLIVMVLIAPLAYLGASYYNGEDGVQKLKDLFNLGKSKTEVTPTVDSTATGQATSSECAKLRTDLDYATRRIEELKQENEDLRRKLIDAEKSK